MSNKFELERKYELCKAEADRYMQQQSLARARDSYKQTVNVLMELLPMLDVEERKRRLVIAKGLVSIIETLNSKLNGSSTSTANNSGSAPNRAPTSNAPSANRNSSSEDTAQEGDSEFNIVNDTGITFDDVVGADDIKAFVRKSWINRFDPRYKKIYENKAKPSKIDRGLLLYGLPGTGKTFMAKAIASEVNGTFFLVDGKMADKMVGETEKAISRLFARASKEKLAIIFIDEIDDMLSGSTDSSASYKQSALNQWLREMEGFSDASSNVIVIGSTNFPNRIAPSAISRMAQRFRVDVPDFALRQAMIQRELNSDYIQSPDIYNTLARLTSGYSARGIRDVCNKIKQETELLQTSAIDNGMDPDSAFTLMLNAQQIEASMANSGSAISQQSMMEIDQFEKLYSINNSSGDIFEYMNSIDYEND